MKNISSSVIFIIIFFSYCVTLIYPQTSNWTYYNSNNSPLPAHNVTIIKQDTEGTYWIGSYSGLIRFDGDNWEIFNEENSDLPNNFIEDFAFDNQGHIWIANFSHIVEFDYASQNMMVIPIEDSTGYEATAIEVDADDIKWIGSYLGLQKFDDTTFSVVLNDDISSIFFDGTNLWVGTNDIIVIGGKLYLYSNGQFNNVMNQIGFIYNSPSVNQIRQDNLGRIWVSTPYGVAHLDGNSWTVYDDRDWGAFSLNIPVGVAFDSENNICIGISNSGFEGKLFVKETGFWEIITESNSAYTGSFIFDIFNDDQGRIWIANSAGILVYDGNLTEIEVNNDHWRANGWELLSMSVTSIDTQYTNSELYTGSSSQGNSSQLFSGKGEGAPNPFNSDYYFELGWSKKFNELSIPDKVVLDYKILNASSNIISSYFWILFDRVGPGSSLNLASNQWQTTYTPQIQMSGPFSFLTVGIITTTAMLENVEFDILLDNLRFIYPGDTILVESFGDDSLTIIENEEYLNTYHSFELSQNYPNPFNPVTTINYQIPEISTVTLKVYDVLGNEIASLVNEEKPTGSYEVKFDASSLPSGIYFYRLQAGSFVESKKMMLLK